MEKELIEALKKVLQEGFCGCDYSLVYTLDTLCDMAQQWLHDQQLDPDTFTRDERTLLAIRAMRALGMRVN